MNTSYGKKPPAYRTILCACCVVAALSTLSACSALTSRASSQSDLVLNFATSTASDWTDHTADSGSTVIQVNAHGSQLHVVSGSSEEKKISRRIDASAFRKMRVLASVHVGFRSHQPLAFAAMRMSVERAGRYAEAWDTLASQHASDGLDKALEVALDVPSDATSLEVELDVNGEAEVQFDAPKLTITASPVLRSLSLTSEETSALQSLTRLVGYLRFFHPSDEVARLAWTTFEGEAVHRLLAANSHHAQLRDVLMWVVAEVAPTARLYEEGHRPPLPPPPPNGPGTKLTRWVRIGSGDDGEPYSSFRTGMSEPSDVGVTLLKTAPSQGCQHVAVRLASTIRQSSPVFELYIIPRRGSGSPSVTSRIVSSVASTEGTIPPEATEITYGVRIGGEGVVDVSEVELTCNNKVLSAFSKDGDPDISGTAYHLYSVVKNRECAGCFRISRRSDDVYQPSKDEVDVAIGFGLRLRMPLAVWTDGKRTFPEASPARELYPRPLPPSDPASRIASALDIWTTLRWFYPYFDDLHINWDDVLPEALTESARAASADELLSTLRHLVARLHDDHAIVYRPAYDDGVLPLVFYYADSKVYLVNGIGQYRSVVPRGSVLESVDGVPTDVVTKQMTRTISAATPAWLNAYLPLVLGEGPIGAMVSIRVRQPDGKLTAIRVPRFARKFILQKHEDRPATGSEIGAGVYYVDLAKVDLTSWKSLLPKLSSSRGLVCDARGGASSAAFQILAHFIDHEIKSPYWDTPIVSTTERKYQRSQLSIFPSVPRLSTKLVFVVDGRTASSPETILQYARAAGLGVVVGESTGGTNGDVASFDSLGGLRVRFTGLRTLNQDESKFHGRGITPDFLVHPTIGGMLAGRDEILEAAIARIAAP